MKKSTRALVGLVVLELVVLAGAWWMVGQVQSGAIQAPDPAEAIARISEVTGGVMAVLAVVLILAFIAHKRRGN